MAIDLSNLSPDQLKQIISEAKNRLNGKLMPDDSKIQELVQSLHDVAERRRTTALDVYEVLGVALKGRMTIEPKYRHPSDPSLTWSGRGRARRWVTEWLEEDKTRKLDDLLIK